LNETATRPRLQAGAAAVRKAIEHERAAIAEVKAALALVE
jgi:hypothetical protein